MIVELVGVVSPLRVAGGAIVFLTLLGLVWTVIVRPLVGAIRAVVAELQDHRYLPELVGEHDAMLERHAGQISDHTRRLHVYGQRLRHLEHPPERRPQ